MAEVHVLWTDGAQPGEITYIKPVAEIAAEANTLPSGSRATARVSGTEARPVFSFGIPAGPKGEKGEPGPTNVPTREFVQQELRGQVGPLVQEELSGAIDPKINQAIDGRVPSIVDRRVQPIADSVTTLRRNMVQAQNVAQLIRPTTQDFELKAAYKIGRLVALYATINTSGYSDPGAYQGPTFANIDQSILPVISTRVAVPWVAGYVFSVSPDGAIKIAANLGAGNFPSGGYEVQITWLTA